MYVLWKPSPSLVANPLFLFVWELLHAATGRLSAVTRRPIAVRQCSQLPAVMGRRRGLQQQLLTHALSRLGGERQC